MSFLLFLDSSTAPGGLEKSDDFTIYYPNGIKLDGDWNVALVSASVVYSWYNISAEYGNNVFRYYNGTMYQPDVIIPPGQYSIDQLDSFVKSVLKENGDFTLLGMTEIYDINISPNFSTGKVLIQVTNGYTFDLQLSNLHLLLGFDSIEVTVTQYGSNLADITRGVDNLLIHLDIIEPSGSYYNALSSDILYTFIPDVLPHSTINVKTPSFLYVPISVTSNVIKRVRLYLTDDKNRRVNLNGQSFSALLSFVKA